MTNKSFKWALLLLPLALVLVMMLGHVVLAALPLLFLFFVTRGFKSEWKRYSFNGRSPLSIIFGFVVVLGSLLGIMYLLDERGKQILRDQFHLSEAVAFIKMERPKGNFYPVAGSVRFTESQWQDYLERNKDPAYWPMLRLRDDYMVGGVSYQGLQPWHDLPLAPLKESNGIQTIDDWPKHYIFLDRYQQRYQSLYKIGPVKRGKMFCVVMHLGKPAACGDLTKRDPAPYAVIGILDEDAKTLYMRVR